jgi:hypothetical protein
MVMTYICKRYAQLNVVNECATVIITDSIKMQSNFRRECCHRQPLSSGARREKEVQATRTQMIADLMLQKRM